MRGSARVGRTGRGAVAASRASRVWRLRCASIIAFTLALLAARIGGAQDAPERLDRGRFTAVFYPSEQTLARSLLDDALRTDTFPGLPRPQAHVLLAIAPDRQRFREWVGPGAPEWGAAITFPDSRRIVMQGRSAGADAGDPRDVLRHELAHLALHEYLGDLPPRWFDEGYASYAAHEWNREDALSANVALAMRGTPTLIALDSEFDAGATTAQNAYALAYRAVVELAELGGTNGLASYFVAWKREGDMDRAMRSAYGLTLDGFEKRWQQRTRRRYGGLALLGDVRVRRNGAAGPRVAAVRGATTARSATDGGDACRGRSGRTRGPGECDRGTPALGMTSRIPGTSRPTRLRRNRIVTRLSLSRNFARHRCLTAFRGKSTLQSLW